MHMEEDSSPLLARLIDDSLPPAPGRRDMKDTLQLLSINSVFDIVRLPETEFSRQVAQHTDDDAASLHLKARSAAAQLETLFRGQQVSPPAADAADATATRGVTYNALFKEDWQHFCASTSIAAMDSPVAYLRALYLFALQLEKNAHGAAVTTLAKRRPDFKDLLITPHSVSGQRPMLSIINQTLLDNLTQGDQKKACRLLSSTWYPFSLPYHAYHHQCVLGLSENKLSLGELNYRISRKLPITTRAAHAYGQVVADHDDAQLLLSGLSPQQQALLKQPLADNSRALGFYHDYYNWDKGPDLKGPERVTDFLRHTGLNAEQLQVLLAQTTHKPRRSPYCSMVTDAAYGACYINGPTGPAISQDSTRPARLLNVTVEGFDRLQRMIRLNRWLDVPFAQLDTLLVSAMRCEGEANPSLLITHNTLRALGVYRYLHTRYALQAEEFAAILHQLPVDASGERLSLFDQVFNRADSALPPLQLDGQPFDATTRQQLCASLGLQDSPSSLQLLLSADRHPRRTVVTLSILYRHARIARLFGLSLMDCKHLLHLLKPGGYQQQLSRPTLRTTLKGSPDVLDVLMHLDWASRWIKKNGSTLARLRHQLLLEPVSLDPGVGMLLDVFNSHPQPSLSKKLKERTLVAQPAEEHPRLPTIDWEATTHRALKLMRQGKSQSAALDEALATLKLSNHSSRASALIRQAKDTLLSTLDSLKQDLQPLYARLKLTLQKLPQAQGSQTRYLKYDEDDQLLRLLAPVGAASSPLQTLSHLVLLLPHAVDLLQLPISRQALDHLLVNPHWLNDIYKSHSLLELTLHNLFLMEQFKYSIDHYGVSEEQLLDYFKQANSVSDGMPSSSAEAHSQLAQLLGWSAGEIEILSQSLQPPRITSIERLDWILRCRQASADIGLPVEQLLDICRLHSGSTFDEWQAVGEALTSTHQ
ncbi:insecticidal toxin complex protein TcaA2 [Pseudomonas sp. MAFF 301449]|uniref:Insecticidal toxin complex protein TcaA2 n=2 Tax=Pseudomonas cyclaminis TaxID=2781239 RepID=A0ABR9SNI6_9PSED|nr:insecticidal toxin complex protein TcaA2 [Pseudomonas cyclaminis]MBE8599671.1 insecticidal toxin complex protein TcaA2 [Pseudomonas cyclaminis]